MTHVTIEREALKLAQEALDSMRIVDFSVENLVGWNKAIAAVRLARSAPPNMPYGWVRMNAGFNSGVFHLGTECPPGWVGGAVPVSKIAQSLAQPAVQEPVAWPCVIAEADFEQDTITLKMQCSDYKVGAGQHWLHTTQPAALAAPVPTNCRHCGGPDNVLCGGQCKAAQPAPADTDLMACWVEKPDGTIDGIASMRLALSKYGTATQPAQPAVPDLTHDQWDEWQNKHGLILEREALDELRSMLYTTPPTQPAPVWRYWKVKDRCVVTGPFTTTSKEEAYGPDCIDATPLTVPAAQPAAPLTAWQPIETAPRDGRWVITFDGETVSPNYYLGSEIEHWAKTPLLVNPTHWMPIPTAPDKGGAVCRL